MHITHTIVIDGVLYAPTQKAREITAPTTVGQRLIQLREARAMTQVETARRAKLSPQTLCAYESDLKHARTDKLVDIFHALRASDAEMLYTLDGRRR